MNATAIIVPGLDPTVLSFHGLLQFYMHHAMPSRMGHGRCRRRRNSEFIVTLFKYLTGSRRNVTVAEVKNIREATF